MTGPSRQQPTAPSPGPTLVHELVFELGREGLSARVWSAFWRRAWAGASRAVREEPGRLRSFLVWAGVGAGLGAAVLVVAARGDPRAGWLAGAAWWALWYAVTSSFVALHLGMVETEEGKPYHGLLLPNGLSFLRLGHAPLVGCVLASAGCQSLEGKALCVYLGVLVGTDLVDGLLARALRQTSRLGGMLDALADMAIQVFLAVGLHRHGMISTLLFVLLLVRYLGALVGGLVVVFLRGPLPLRHTLVGRATSFSSSFVLVAAAVLLVASPSWLPAAWVTIGLHALTDALLGAIGDGDIGQHFPPSDPKWKGAASRIFLEDAASRVRARGGRIGNVDLTLLCEAPRIGPYRDAMRRAIAEMLGIAPERVGVKATTTERLGFTGRREGIAAMATATVVLPG
jgi:2-C-methyl-D-erythritol 2,4-cyclodiphosphate synthase